MDILGNGSTSSVHGYGDTLSAGARYPSMEQEHQGNTSFHSGFRSKNLNSGFLNSDEVNHLRKGLQQSRQRGNGITAKDLLAMSDEKLVAHGMRAATVSAINNLISRMEEYYAEVVGKLEKLRAREDIFRQEVEGEFRYSRSRTDQATLSKIIDPEKFPQRDRSIRNIIRGIEELLDLYNGSAHSSIGDTSMKFFSKVSSVRTMLREWEQDIDLREEYIQHLQNRRENRERETREIEEQEESLNQRQEELRRNLEQLRSRLFDTK